MKPHSRDTRVELLPCNVCGKLHKTQYKKDVAYIVCKSCGSISTHIKMVIQLPEVN